MSAGHWNWISPNGVTHLVEAGGCCCTCGRRHAPAYLTAWARDGGRAVDVSAWGRRLNLHPAPAQALCTFDPEAADALLAAAGYARDGEWTAMSGECRAAHLTALPAASPPGGDEWTVRLPLTGAEGPLVTAWYVNGAGDRHAAMVTYPDGSRCAVRLADRSLSWADPQVWDNSNRARYQLEDWYCPGHGPSGVCEYGQHDQVRYTGPLTTQERTRPINTVHDEWEPAGTGTPGDQVRDLKIPGYWAVIGPHHPAGYGWTVVDSDTGEDVATGKAGDEHAAKAAVSDWEDTQDPSSPAMADRTK